MRRVHRNLASEQTSELREKLYAQLPQSDLPIGTVIRQMRLSIKRSQSEYAKLCGVSPRVLAAIEAGTGNPTLSTVESLLLPFACGLGIVRLADEELRERRSVVSKKKKAPSRAP